MDFAKISGRARKLLLTPQPAWAEIAADPEPADRIFLGHVLLLSAVAAIGSWALYAIPNAVFSPIRMGLRGLLLPALSSMLVSFLVVFAGARAANALAPRFGGQSGLLQATKTIAYALTGYWIASAAGFLPLIGGVIAFAGGIYSIFLLHMGCQQTLKIPANRAMGFTVVLALLCALLFYGALILTWPLAWVTGIR